MNTTAGILILVLAAAPAPQAETKPLLSFEQETDLAAIATNGAKALAARHATEGKHSLQLSFDAVAPQFALPFAAPADFSGYERLKIDTTLAGLPLVLTLRVRDAAGARYTSWYHLVNEGRQTIEYSIRGMASKVDVSKVAELHFAAEDRLPTASYRVDASSAQEKVDLGKHSSVLFLDHVRLHRGPHDDSWLTPPGAAPPQEIPTGLIVNGSFELGLLRWGSWGTWDNGLYFFGCGRGENARGRSSAGIFCQKKGRGGIMSETPFALRRGDYRLTYWAKATVDGTKMFHSIEGDGAKAISEGKSSGWFPLSTQWTQKSFAVKAAGDSGPVRLYLCHVGEGAIYLDDVALLPEGGAPEAASGKPPAGKPSVVTVKGRVASVNGKPFFPLGFYGDDPSALAGTPFNFITGGGDPGAMLDQCQKLGIMTHVALEGLARAHVPESAPLVARRHKDHPALFGWYLCDEPDHSRWNVPPAEIRAIHKLLRREDPNHPTWIVVMPWADSNLYQYAGTCDILSSDVYPDLGKKPVDVLSLAKAMDVMMTAHPGPVWMVPLSDPKASPGEQTAMTYIALAHGATGIVHWELRSARANEAFWRLLVETAKEIQALAPALLSETAKEAAKVSDPKVHAILKEGPDGRTLVTVNASPDPLPGVAFAHPIFGDGEAKVLFEDRAVKVAGGKLTDDFAGYQRHVYRLGR
jgi:hypothetical protein